jgi:hypothetical protein
MSSTITTDDAALFRKPVNMTHNETVGLSPARTTWRSPRHTLTRGSERHTGGYACIRVASLCDVGIAILDTTSALQQARQRCPGTFSPHIRATLRLSSIWTQRTARRAPALHSPVNYSIRFVIEWPDFEIISFPNRAPFRSTRTSNIQCWSVTRDCTCRCSLRTSDA